MNFSVRPDFQYLPMPLTNPTTSIKLNPMSSIAFYPSTSAASCQKTKNLINTKDASWGTLYNEHASQQLFQNQTALSMRHVPQKLKKKSVMHFFKTSLITAIRINVQQKQWLLPW